MVVAVAIGLVMAYLGFLLANAGAYALTHGNALLGVLALIVGIGLLGIPVVVLVSQLLAVYRRRG